MRIFIIIISIVIAFIIALIWFTIYLVRRRKARNNQDHQIVVTLPTPKGGGF